MVILVSSANLSQTICGEVLAVCAFLAPHLPGRCFTPTASLPSSFIVRGPSRGEWRRSASAVCSAGALAHALALAHTVWSGLVPEHVVVT